MSDITITIPGLFSKKIHGIYFFILSFSIYLSLHILCASLVDIMLLKILKIFSQYLLCDWKIWSTKFKAISNNEGLTCNILLFSLFVVRYNFFFHSFPLSPTSFMLIFFFCSESFGLPFICLLCIFLIYFLCG